MYSYLVIKLSLVKVATYLNSIKIIPVLRNLLPIWQNLRTELLLGTLQRSAPPITRPYFTYRQ